MMTEKEINSKLGWSIRSGRGFYCNGMRFTSLTFYKDGRVDLNNWSGSQFIINAIVESIETIIVEGKTARNVIISAGELI